MKRLREDVRLAVIENEACKEEICEFRGVKMQMCNLYLRKNESNVLHEIGVLDIIAKHLGVENLYSLIEPLSHEEATD